VTLAMAGRVAADFDGPTEGAGTDAESDRFKDACPGKPDAFTYPPDLNDDCVYQDEFAHWLLGEFSAVSGRIAFSLDNEPDLWADTHSEIHPDAATYAEVGAKSVALAAAVRQVAPAAEIYGYAGYGYYGFVSLSGAPDAGVHGDFIDYFLQVFAQAEIDHGARLLDVLDVHWYPEARGGGERITSDSDGDAICAARMQAPRSLWDPDYVEDSWITNDVLGGPIMLLPWFAGRIAANYPGTGLSISEYYYGGGAHICGAIAQADVLGIYGRQGVHAANLWHLGETDDAYINAAFDMFLDFDGNGARFGSRGLVVQVSDTETFSAYAAKREGIDYETTLVLINKRDVPVTVSIRARDYQQFAFGRAWQLGPDAPAPAEVETFQLSGTNAGIITLPATTVTTLVLMPPL
ncbi:glycoside hydrolase family 44 protein, partial [Myxococcota bacterium]|nr:glycoside hydrolase family 44 protein [Myxococcota bacterium]